MKDIFSNICPFPHANHDGFIKNGTIYNIPKYCTEKCKRKECLDIEFDGKFCYYGFNIYKMKFFQQNFTIMGVIGRENEIVGKKLKVLKANKINNRVFDQFIIAKNSLESRVSKYLEEEQSKNISFLHDIKTSTGILIQSVEHLIFKGKGTTFEEKLDETSKEYKEIYHSANILNDQLRYIDLIANPESIKYGIKRITSLYKIFHKFMNLFMDRALKKKVRIKIEGNLYKEYEFYDSFQLVPMILIDNAIKYSIENQNIIIKFSRDEIEKNTIVSVESFGPVIDLEGEVFKKGIRCENAMKYTSEGIGMGLYILKNICEANNLIVWCESVYKLTKDNIKLGHNTFFIKVFDY